MVLREFGDTYKHKGIFMDTNQKMDRMLCEQALERYRAIEAAIEGGRGGYAKERLTDLRSFLKDLTQHSAFRNAHAYLPRASTNLSEWKSELAYSRLSIEDYLRELERNAQ
jgi:hypothetical protein